MEQTRKPVILWLADQEGWAYDSIYKQVSKLLPEYEHRVFYYLQNIPCVGGDELTSIAAQSDIIVSMYLRYADIIPCKEKVMTMLTGLRPFEI